MTSWETIAIIVTAAYNFCILVFSKGLTNRVLFDADPLFSRDGCVLVVIWGLTYMSLAWDYEHAPWAFGVFFLEKMFYVHHWVGSLRSSEALDNCGDDVFTKLFYLIYGAGDFVSGAFFFYIWITHAVL